MTSTTKPTPEPWRLWAVAKLRKYAEEVYLGLDAEKETSLEADRRALDIKRLANRLEKRRAKPIDFYLTVKTFYDEEQSRMEVKP